MANNEVKCGIIYDKNVIQVGSDKQMFNYKWSYGYTHLI